MQCEHLRTHARMRVPLNFMELTFYVKLFKLQMLMKLGLQIKSAWRIIPK